VKVLVTGGVRSGKSRHPHPDWAERSLPTGLDGRRGYEVHLVGAGWRRLQRELGPPYVPIELPL
jgi:hypothetical protein